MVRPRSGFAGGIGSGLRALPLSYRRNGGGPSETADAQNTMLNALDSSIEVRLGELRLA